MKTIMMILLFALTACAMAAEPASRASADRAVADDLETVTLPTGEIVTRLVSRSGTTARRFWVDSVYGNRERIVVFQGGGGIVEGYAAAPIGQNNEPRTIPTDPASNDRIDLLTQELNGR